MSSTEKPPAVELWDEALDGPSSRPDEQVAFASMFFRVFIVGMAAVWLVAAVGIFSDLVIDLMAALLLIAFGFVVALGWVTWSLYLYGGVACLRSRWEIAEWAFVPLAGLLGVVLLATDLDTVLRLKLSEPAILRCLVEPRSGDSNDLWEDGGRWVGLFWFRGIQDQPGSIELRSDSTYPAGGLVYCPQGTPKPASREHRYHQLSGRWWGHTQNY